MSNVRTWMQIMNEHYLLQRNCFVCTGFGTSACTRCSATTRFKEMAEEVKKETARIINEEKQVSDEDINFNISITNNSGVC